MKFEDLKWEKHPMTKQIELLSKDQQEIFGDEYTNSKQVLYMSDCGVEFSILFGKPFYSNGVDTYEIWAINDLLRSLRDYSDPSGYLTADEIVDYIATACKEFKDNFGEE